MIALIPPQVRWMLAAAALVMAFLGGVKVESLRWHAHEAKALKQAQIAFERQLAKQQTESEAYEQEREAGRRNSLQRQSQVRTIYRDRVVDPGCAVPADAKRLLEQARTSANQSAAEPGK